MLMIKLIYVCFFFSLSFQRRDLEAFLEMDEKKFKDNKQKFASFLEITDFSCYYR